MTRYYITHQTLSYNCGLIEVNMTSHTPQHLWLLYTTKAPQVDPIPDIQQPGNRPHQNNFRTFIEGVIEQEEPGETTHHTFHFALPPSQGIIWFYTINMGVHGLKATRSPIFAYEFIPTPIWQETWQQPDVFNHGWQFTDFPPFSLAYPSLNRLLERKSNIGTSSVQTASADLGNGFGPVVGPFNDCPILFTFTMPPDDTTTPFGQNQIFLRLEPYFRAGFGISLYIVPQPNGNGITDAPPPVNRMVLAVPPGERTISLHAIIALRHAAYPTSMTPGQTSVNQISLSTGGHLDTPFYIHESNFGPLSFYEQSLTPKDVSKYWRAMRLRPTLP